MGVMNQAIAKSIYDDLVSFWGKEPSWEEFKEAEKNNKVSVNKTIAAMAIHHRAVNNGFKLIYGIITPFIGYVVVPLAIILAILGKINFIGVIVSFFVASFFINVSREGHCEGIKDAACKNEMFYTSLMKAGAFLFKPTNN